MENPVLLVIDMLHDFLQGWEATRRQKLVSSINELVGRMRGLGHPVVWVRQEFEPDLRDAFREMKAKGIHVTIKGTQGCQIVSELATAPSDLVIIKNGTVLSTARLLTKHSHGCSPMQSSWRG
jgi:nicotinamidase-related amidase